MKHLPGSMQWHAQVYAQKSSPQLRSDEHLLSRAHLRLEGLLERHTNGRLIEVVLGCIDVTEPCAQGSIHNLVHASVFALEGPKANQRDLDAVVQGFIGLTDDLQMQCIALKLTGVMELSEGSQAETRQGGIGAGLPQHIQC